MTSGKKNQLASDVPKVSNWEYYLTSSGCRTHAGIRSPRIAYSHDHHYPSRPNVSPEMLKMFCQWKSRAESYVRTPPPSPVTSVYTMRGPSILSVLGSHEAFVNPSREPTSGPVYISAFYEGGGCVRRLNPSTHIIPRRKKRRGQYDDGTAQSLIRREPRKENLTVSQPTYQP